MDPQTLELSTSSMPWKRAPNCATGHEANQLFDNNIGPADCASRHAAAALNGKDDAVLVVMGAGHGGRHRPRL